jgi:hypothetical protein
MIRLFRAAASVALVALAAGVTRPLGAQSVIVAFSSTTNDSISPAPVISVTADALAANLQPSSITFVASFENQFRNPFFVGSTSGVTTGSTAQFQLDSLLPQRRTVYFRAQLIDRNGVVRAQSVDSGKVHDWLTLVSPARASNVLFTRQPTFTWSSPAITLPPGPWEYTLSVINTASGDTAEKRFVSGATQFTTDILLDACTSFKWSVTARATNGSASDVITVNSPGTFVIQTAECPTATNFYNNFPNPFGRGASSERTCFWFDLAHRSAVKLTILDARLRQVKRIVPGPIGTVLDSAAYGRQNGSDQSGCDDRLVWDGRDERGQLVPPGLYYAVFEADGKRDTRKILYKGP